VVRRMSAITQSSNRIAEITGVIDGLAFQTNILALNASVEAARAGESGRGFSVVAAEVRQLAQRSADAARQIKQLLETSAAHVNDGAALVDQAGRTMAEIVSSIQELGDSIGHIDRSSERQRQSFAVVSQAIGQIDETTQQNAALVEQSAAAAASLRTQAQKLVDSVSVFKLAAGGAGMAATA
jgi:methyl-accepting chemotaxis protein